MSNGSFVPLSIPPPLGLGDSSERPFVTPVTSSTMNVVASKSAPGHVVAAPSSGIFAGSEVPTTRTKEKYKWHTVVDGFSKYLYYNSRFLSVHLSDYTSGFRSSALAVSTEIYKKTRLKK